MNKFDRIINLRERSISLAKHINSHVVAQKITTGIADNYLLNTVDTLLECDDTLCSVLKHPDLEAEELINSIDEYTKKAITLTCMYMYEPSNN